MTPSMDQNDIIRSGGDLDNGVIRIPMELAAAEPLARQQSASAAPVVPAAAPIQTRWRPFPVEALPEPVKTFVVAASQASLRDVPRFLGGSAPPADDLRTLLDRICQSGIAHWEKTTPGPRGGRPSDIFVLNPDDNTDKTSGSVGSAGFVIGEVAETKRGEACNE